MIIRYAHTVHTFFYTYAEFSTIIVFWYAHCTGIGRFAAPLSLVLQLYQFFIIFCRVDILASRYVYILQEI
jgi:hypothetical protein